MVRIVILGTGTNVGKTYVTAQLAKALSDQSFAAVVTALKPIESGTGRTAQWHGHELPFPRNTASASARESQASDASILGSASSPPFAQPQHAYEFAEPLSPHLAARLSNMQIDISLTVSLACKLEAVRYNNTLHCTTYHASDEGDRRPSPDREWLLVETPRGPYSPHLARAPPTSLSPPFSNRRFGSSSRRIAWACFTT